MQSAAQAVWLIVLGVPAVVGGCVRGGFAPHPDQGRPHVDGGGPCHPTTVVDAFDRPDAGALGNGWLAVSGGLEIVAMEVRNAVVKGRHLAVLPEICGPRQAVAASFASLDNNPGPRFGVVLRYRDPGNYYYVYRQVGATAILAIAKVVDGVETTLAQTGASNPPVGQLFRLEGQANGPTLDLELDGAYQLQASDGTFAEGGVGMVLETIAPPLRAHRADDFQARVE